MTYQEILLAFREASGRYDLVSSVGEGSQAIKFVQAAQDYLDSKWPRWWNRNVYLMDTSANSYIYEIQRCLTIESIRLRGDEASYLERVPESSLLTMYPQIEYGESVGVPVYFALTSQRPGDDMMNSPSLPSDTELPGKYIMLGPAPDDIYHLEVRGTYRTPKFNSTASSENNWTVYYPMVLVWASCYMLEIFYRNTEGARDWLVAIEDFLTQIDHDEAEQQLDESNTLGEWS